jgi:hypothetical protein
MACRNIRRVRVSSPRSPDVPSQATWIASSKGDLLSASGSRSGVLATVRAAMCPWESRLLRNRSFDESEGAKLASVRVSAQAYQRDHYDGCQPC